MPRHCVYVATSCGWTLRRIDPSNSVCAVVSYRRVPHRRAHYPEVGVPDSRSDGREFFSRKQVCREVANFSCSEGDHSAAYDEAGLVHCGESGRGVADFAGAGIRAEIGEIPGGGDASSAVAGPSTQSMRKKGRYEDTRPRRRKTCIFPSERRVRTPTELSGLPRIRSRNCVVAEWQLIDENSTTGQIATFAPRFNRGESISAGEVGRREVVGPAIIQIWMWMVFVGKKGPDVATKAFSPGEVPVAVFSFACEVVRLRGTVEARQFNVASHEVGQSWQEWQGRLTS